MIRHLAILSGLFALLLFSCNGLREMPRPITVCPPKGDPICQSSNLNAEHGDARSQSQAEFYYSVRTVRGLQSRIDEWALAFNSKSDVIVSLHDASNLHVNRGRLITFDSVTLTQVIPFSQPGSYGIVSPGSSMLLTAYPYSNYSGDADVYAAKIVGDSLVMAERNSTMSLDQTWDAQPSQSSDGRVVFFASDRPGGYGGTDIWFVKKRADGTWTSPINAGPSVNSACDDLSPFVSPDSKTLLFSSSGHEGLGGYDIFQVDLAGNFVSKVDSPTDSTLIVHRVNLGSPLNTKADELFPSTPSNAADLVYYSSNQNAATGFDIYVRRKEHREKHITKAEPPVPEVSPEKTPEMTPETTSTIDSVEVHGKVRNEKNEVVPHADVTARDVQRNTTTARTVTNDSGDYTLTVPANRDMEIVAQYEGGFYDSYRVSRAPRERETQMEHNFTVPSVLYLRINFPTDKFQDPYNNVLDSNGAETRQMWNEALDRVAENLKNFSAGLKRVVLVGHTDEVGTDEYNKALGKRRVDFVVEELVKRGLKKSLFLAQSAGESQPLMRRPNESQEDYYKRNRRVELSKIMQ